MLEAAARFEAAEVVEVVGLARSVDEVEQAASVAARWVHARDPGEGQRQAVAYALRAKVIVLPVDAFAVASALLVEPSAELWETLHRRTPRLTPLLFDVLHREVARRPAVFLESIQTARVPALWKEHIERVAGLPGEPCRCPDCRYKDADCGEFAGGAELERGPGR